MELTPLARELAENIKRELLHRDGDDLFVECCKAVILPFLAKHLAAKDAMLAAATDVIRQCKDAIDSVTFHSIRGYATVYIIDSRKHYEARRVAAGWLEPTKGAEHHV